VMNSHGALHLRTMALAAMDSRQQQLLARATTQLGLQLSVEAGGTMCGAGSGMHTAQAVHSKITPFLSAGGTIQFLLLESIFSRTTAGCANQSHSDTAAQVAQFAAGLKEVLGPTVTFFLYDALPHFAVGAEWPPNTASAHYQLELGTILTALQAAMQAADVKLTGYWLVMLLCCMRWLWACDTDNPA
jgi:hypothetical protein